MSVHSSADKVRAHERDSGLQYPYKMNLAGCDPAQLGREDLSDISDPDMTLRLARAVGTMRADYIAGAQPILSSACVTSDLQYVKTALGRLSEGANTIVFFGTGGSSLGGQVLAQVGGGIPDEKSSHGRTEGAAHRPRMRFYDNLDGRTLARALDDLDLASTRFVVTSKSGNTAETLTQTVVAIQAIIGVGLEARIPELFLGVSEPDCEVSGNGLRRLCSYYGIACLDHPTDIGGRYSPLTVVGMLPALALGMDGVAIRSGAQAVVDDMTRNDVLEWAPAAGALAIASLQARAGVQAIVMMPYCDRLGHLARWYVQLFGESLGKDGTGGTPVAALGPVDQHSQLQLWMDGPRHHMVTFIRETSVEGGPRIPDELARLAGIDYLAGRTVGSLVAAQSVSVPEALRRAGRPNRTFEIEQVDEWTIGGLMMHFMIETILLGELMGVDPYDQPAVELGKCLARDLLRSTG